jgi:predicted outer membrane protein
MRHGTFAVALLFAAAPAFAQGSASSAARAQDKSAATASTSDKQFVKNMIQANMAEIQLGQLAADHAQNSDVKEYARMIVDDHTKANQKLLTLAQQLGVDQPNGLDAKHKAIEARLSKLNGAEFDRQFMQAMVQDHQQVISKTKQEAPGAAGNTGTGTTGATGTSGSTSPSPSAGMDQAPDTARQYASMTLPILQKHLQDARQIQQRIKK